MKQLVMTLLVCTMFSCNFNKSVSYANYKGIYFCNTPEQKNVNFVLLDTLNNKFSGFYFGSQIVGDNEMLYYVTEIKDLSITEDRISFKIGERELFKESQFKISKGQTAKDSVVGLSKDKLEFSGLIKKDTININSVLKL